MFIICTKWGKIQLLYMWICLCYAVHPRPSIYTCAYKDSEISVTMMIRKKKAYWMQRLDRKTRKNEDQMNFYYFTRMYGFMCVRSWVPPCSCNCDISLVNIVSQYINKKRMNKDFLCEKKWNLLSFRICLT